LPGLLDDDRDRPGFHASFIWKKLPGGGVLIGDPGSIHVRTVFLVQISIHQQTAPTVAGLSFLTFFVAGQFTRTVFNYFLI
tara:strand:- start:517 stop:759 length:243 start_codon:yes stop_codon:yes gene_type:complete